MNRCQTCHKLFIFADEEQRHRCPPRWEVWDDREGRESFRMVFALDAEEAAEKQAEYIDSGGDYDIVSGRHSPVLCVAREGEETVKRFRIEGEAIPSYHAEEIPK